MPAGKLFWGIPSAAGSRFTLFRPTTALEIHRFYPRNDNHAATMTTYLRNSLKLISNDRNGFQDFEDPDCVRPQTGDAQRKKPHY